MAGKISDLLAITAPLTGSQIEVAAKGTITAVTNANPAVITSTAHGLATGQSVTISGVVGATGVNGVQTITVVDANTFSVPVAAGGAYTSGGLWRASVAINAENLLQAIGLVSSGNLQFHSYAANGATYGNVTVITGGAGGEQGFMVKRSDGTAMIMVSDYNQVQLGNTLIAGGMNITYQTISNNNGIYITAGDGTKIPLTIRGQSGQTANLLNITDSVGTVLTSFGPNGEIRVSNASYPGRWLQISHDASHSYLQDNFFGNIYINGGFAVSNDGHTVYDTSANYQIQASSQKLVLSKTWAITWDSIGNTANNAPGVGLTRSSAGNLKVTDGSTGYGNVDANVFKSNGTAGVSGTFTAGAQTVTVTNGLITAIV